MPRIVVNEPTRPRAGSLLVASAGGHLAQLHQLLPRLHGLPGPVT